MKTKVYRHGDLVLRPIKVLPTGLTLADTDTITRGSGGNPHKALNCEIYFKQVNTFVFAYLVAKAKAKLLHKDHGVAVKGKQLKEAHLPVGVYELRHQVEDTNEGMRIVVD